MAEKKKKKITKLKLLKRAVVLAEAGLLFSLFFVAPPHIMSVLALMAGLLFFYHLLALC